MTARLTVDLSELAMSAGIAEAARTGRDAEVSAAIDSLPLSLRVADRPGQADIVAVTGEGWARRALSAVREGILGVLVIEPGFTDPADLEALNATRAAVVIDSSWRHNSAVDEIVPEFTKYRRSGALLEARSLTPPSTDPAVACLGLLDLVTALAGDLQDLRLLTGDPRHVMVTGRFRDETFLSLGILMTTGAARQATVRITGGDGAAAISLPDPGIAAPASATLTGLDGHTLLPTSYESAHRVALRRLADTVAGSAPTELGDLARFRRYARELAPCFASKSTDIKLTKTNAGAYAPADAQGNVQ